MKMSQPSGLQCFHLAALVATTLMVLVGAINTNSECQENLGTICYDKMQCLKKCKEAHSDGRGECYDGVTCVCHYGCIESTCRRTLGFCDKTCDSACCGNKCLHEVPGSYPVCDVPPGLNVTFCNCEYPC